MTIAAGFVCQDGVVLCADTQITAGMKLHRAKVGHVSFPKGVLIFAYAGNVRFANSAIGKCERHLLSAKFTEPLSEIEAVLDKEYRRNVLSNPSYQSDFSLRYQFILGLWNKGTHEAKLYVTTETAISEVNEYECIGVGEHLAHYLLRPSFKVRMKEQDATAVIAYMMANVKDYVDGCGGMSVYTILQNDGSYGLVTSEHDGPTKELEKYAKKYDWYVRELFAQLVSSDLSDDQFEAYLKGTFDPKVSTMRREWSSRRQELEDAFVKWNPTLDPAGARRIFRKLCMGIVPERPQA